MLVVCQLWNYCPVSWPWLGRSSVWSRCPVNTWAVKPCVVSHCVSFITKDKSHTPHCPLFHLGSWTSSQARRNSPLMLVTHNARLMKLPIFFFHSLSFADLCLCTNVFFLCPKQIIICSYNHPVPLHFYLIVSCICYSLVYLVVMCLLL